MKKLILTLCTVLFLGSSAYASGCNEMAAFNTKIKKALKTASFNEKTLADIKNLQSEREDLLKPNSQVCLGALFSCNFGNSVEYFFFAGTAGGQSVLIEGHEVTVITAQSPLAGILLGSKAGDGFSMPNGSIGQILTVE